MQDQILNESSANETEVLKSPGMYPTPPDEEGFYFEDEDDFNDEIKTKKYENGKRVKSFILPDGRNCVVRELSGADSVEISSIQSNSKDKEDSQKDYMPMVMWRACKVDEKQLPFEDYKEMTFKCYNKIMLVVSSLNF